MRETLYRLYSAYTFTMVLLGVALLIIAVLRWQLGWFLNVLLVLAIINCIAVLPLVGRAALGREG